MPRPFLTAEWRYLLNVTFPVPPDILLPHVPPGVTLDIQEGQAFASIVAFHFLDTRVRGLRIPFHINFPEINLRYYVKRGERRGVVFWKELVPKYCIAAVANQIYNEPYEATRMHVALQGPAAQRELLHTFRYGGAEHRIRAVFDETQRHIPEPGSTEHYFKEHDIGFGQTRRGAGRSYDVIHPRWAVHPLLDYELDMDFARLYGEQWAFLAHTQPINALLAEGSAVAVYPAQ